MFAWMFFHVKKQKTKHDEHAQSTHSDLMLIRYQLRIRHATDNANQWHMQYTHTPFSVCGEKVKPWARRAGQIFSLVTSSESEPSKALSPLPLQQPGDYWTIPFHCHRGLKYMQPGLFLHKVWVCVSQMTRLPVLSFSSRLYSDSRDMLKWKVKSANWVTHIILLNPNSTSWMEGWWKPQRLIFLQRRIFAK